MEKAGLGPVTTTEHGGIAREQASRGVGIGGQQIRRDITSADIFVECTPHIACDQCGIRWGQ